jgi:hypothetical protein
LYFGAGAGVSDDEAEVWAVEDSEIRALRIEFMI